jgi:hypothetical protein
MSLATTRNSSGLAQNATDTVTPGARRAACDRAARPADAFHCAPEAGRRFTALLETRAWANDLAVRHEAPLARRCRRSAPIAVDQVADWPAVVAGRPGSYRRVAVDQPQRRERDRKIYRGGCAWYPCWRRARLVRAPYRVAPAASRWAPPGRSRAHRTTRPAQIGVARARQFRPRSARLHQHLRVAVMQQRDHLRHDTLLWVDRAPHEASRVDLGFRPDIEVARRSRRARSGSRHGAPRRPPSKSAPRASSTTTN